MSHAGRDLLLITFDALRYDVAASAYHDGSTPFLRSLLPHGWEPRHTSGSFTYAAHAALFAGFWPTPVTPGRHVRPFALPFPGSRTIGKETQLLDGANIVAGLRAAGYLTVCIGGVGFFNPTHPLGTVFPGYFDRSDWRAEFGVTALQSTRAQVGHAVTVLNECPGDQPVFLFLNISATHPPTRGYLPEATAESVQTQQAALAYVDTQLPPLWAALQARGRGGTGYLMSDHGTLFGEDGWQGHRVGHPTVWTVPYGEAAWEAAG